MKLAVFLLVPISAWLACNKNVVITHTNYEGNHRLTIKSRFGTYTTSTFLSWIYGGSNHRIHFGTHNSYDLKDEQIWTLECDSSPDKDKEGYFYIVNVAFPKARLAQWGPNEEDTGYFVGRKIDNNQLWKIILSDGNGTSGSICNYEYSDHCLVKWGHDDHEVGTRSHTYNSAQSTWYITPLYYNPGMKWNRIQEIDNTRGQKPIVQTVSYEVGISFSTIGKISVDIGTEMSTALAPLGIPGLNVTMEGSITNERTKKHTEQTQFTINAGENWWLCQGTVVLDSWAGREDVEINSRQLQINSNLC